jgi:hypothetical protein
LKAANLAVSSPRSKSHDFASGIEFGGSGSEEEATAQEVEFGATVHGALEELETVDHPPGADGAKVSERSTKQALL